MTSFHPTHVPFHAMHSTPPPRLAACPHVIAILALAWAGAAHAQTVYSGLQDIAIPTGMDGVFLDLNTGASSATEMTGWDINLFLGGYAIANSATFQPVRATTAQDALVLNLLPGTLVDGAGVYATGPAGSEGHLGNAAGQFQAGTEGYLGFQFDPGGGLGPYYGWMRVVLTADDAGGLIRDWAYRNDGQGLAVGVTTVVPEPSTWAMGAVFGTGAVATVLLRRRRQATPS